MPSPTFIVPHSKQRTSLGSDLPQIQSEKSTCPGMYLFFFLTLAVWSCGVYSVFKHRRACTTGVKIVVFCRLLYD